MDGSYEYTPVRESDADFLELLRLMYTPDSPSQKNFSRRNSTRRRSFSESNLDIYAVFCEQHTLKKGRRSSLLPSNTSIPVYLGLDNTVAQGASEQIAITVPTVSQPSSEEIATTIQYGLLNLIRPTFESAPQRNAEHIYTVRLNMINMYLKYVIQALLYFVAATLILTIATGCAKFLGIMMLPFTLICALHLAAREMHQPHNRLHETNAHQDRSLIEGEGQDWTTQIHCRIDRRANYSVGFFSGLTSRLANSSMFDKQIAHIPDNSSNLRNSAR